MSTLHQNNIAATEAAAMANHPILYTNRAMYIPPDDGRKYNTEIFETHSIGSDCPEDGKHEEFSTESDYVEVEADVESLVGSDYVDVDFENFSHTCVGCEDMNVCAACDDINACAGYEDMNACVVSPPKDYYHHTDGHDYPYLYHPRTGEKLVYCCGLCESGIRVVRRASWNMIDPAG